MAGAMATIALQAPSLISGWSLGLRAKRPADLVARVERGLSIAAMERLQRRLDLSAEELAALLGVSPRTLARRTKAGRLEATESDRLYRLARLYERAVDVLGDEEESRRWFRAPQWGLGGATALEFARTDPGAREVEALLDRIDYGVLA
jgi:putative toxin-antitoxin system antitoxin component (TIGR02293 family)